MCGILGLLAPGTQPDLRTQLDLLAHRGPDEGGHYSDADIFLGTRRLSIIDVAGGQQPLSVADGTVWVIQNGEIYNYLALQAELEARGPRLPYPQRHRGHCRRLCRLGAQLRPAPARHLRLCGLGHRPAAGCCWRVTASGSSRFTWPAAGRRAGLCVRDPPAAGPAAGGAGRPGGAAGAVRGGVCAQPAHGFLPAWPSCRPPICWWLKTARCT